MDTSTIGLLYGGITLLLLFSGMPIAFALGLSALGFIVVFMPAPMIHSVAETIYSELDNFTLLTIPLFVLMGAAIGKTRAGSDVYNSLNAWMYRVPGGLGLANVFACAVFAAMCGSTPATCSAIRSRRTPRVTCSPAARSVRRHRPAPASRASSPAAIWSSRRTSGSAGGSGRPPDADRDAGSWGWV